MSGQVISIGSSSHGKKFPFSVDLLEEPALQFSEEGWAFDPKIGLTEYGPRGRSLDLHVPRINVGFVGTGQTIEQAHRWLDRCSQPIPAIDNRQRQAPAFPGFNESTSFAATFGFHRSWEAQITEREFEAVSGAKDRKSRFENMVGLVAGKVQQVTERDHRPDVIICALPWAITRNYWSLGGRGTSKSGLTRLQRTLLRQIRRDGESGQGVLFPEAFELTEENGTGLAYRDFRRALKAKVMKWHCPIQIVQERTLRDGPDVQDPATRAWNFCTALYFKAGGLPWTLAETEPDVCFVGVSFYRHIKQTEQWMHSSLAQVFSDRGDGIVVRGEPFRWNPEKGSSPHLTEDSAQKLIERALNKYHEMMGTLPRRVVVHKSSRYEEDELKGFRAGLQNISLIDLVALYQTGTRFFREGMYPPIRGTICEVGGAANFLYTQGFIPSLGTYPGPYVPEPIQLVEHYGDSSAWQICNEILALTKMNWNSAAFACAFPITLVFARQVGKIMSEIPDNEEPHPSYRFYI